MGKRWKNYEEVVKTLPNEELHYLYCSPNIIRVIKSKDDEMGEACGMHGGLQNCTNVFSNRI
jgi:hypothetical protein